MLAVIVFSPVAGRAEVSVADVDRVVRGIYEDAVGGSSGDVDADGNALAADIVGALNGMRNPTWPGPYGAGSVEIVGATSASLLHEDHHKMAGFNVYEFDSAGRLKDVSTLCFDPQTKAFAPLVSPASTVTLRVRV